MKSNIVGGITAVGICSQRIYMLEYVEVLRIALRHLAGYICRRKSCPLRDRRHQLNSGSAGGSNGSLLHPRLTLTHPWRVCATASFARFVLSSSSPETNKRAHEGVTLGFFFFFSYMQFFLHHPESGRPQGQQEEHVQSSGFNVLLLSRDC